MWYINAGARKMVKSLKQEVNLVTIKCVSLKKIACQIVSGSITVVPMKIIGGDCTQNKKYAGMSNSEVPILSMLNIYMFFFDSHNFFNMFSKIHSRTKLH
jgi:hypothetical protein